MSDRDTLADVILSVDTLLPDAPDPRGQALAIADALVALGVRVPEIEPDRDTRRLLGDALWQVSRSQDPDEFMPTVMTDMRSCLRAAEALIGRDVWMPPPGAEIQEGRWISPEHNPPWAEGEISFEGDRALDDGVDVTDRYRAWSLTQPGTLTRIYEWAEPTPVCPDCREGKHRICGGEALGWGDNIVPCRCDHGEAD